MMRVAHFSDLHYGHKTLAEADRCFGAAIDQAIALGVDAAVVSGDATDHALDLHAPAVARLAAQVRRLADHCPVLMLQGTFSHELPGTLAILRLLGGRHPVHVAERIEQVALTAQGRWHPSAAWTFAALPAQVRAVFTCVPTVNKATVAATVGATDAALAVGEHLATLLRGFAPLHRAAREQGVPCIGVSHGTVFGCISEHGVPMAGFDHEFTTGALFAAEAQAFLLGHIHRHQAWEQEAGAGHQCIAYAGSIGRFHYGEDGEKGFLLWTVDRAGAHCVLVPTPARRTIDIVFEGPPDLVALREAAAGQDLRDASVRVRWTLGEEERHQADRAAILQALAGAKEVKLEGRIVPVVRTRSPGITQSTSLADKVCAWARATEVQPGPLLGCLEALRVHAPGEIAKRLLDSADAASADELEFLSADAAQ
ncbi:metallophosphatase family protein [Cupriavidus basilensis]|uniref:Metallophosphatase family protein n=1 Tax=Cupriavidus basilensis TaxID=68895 RepID=A0ABT6ASG7_9BURK|nr:metallophosphatase family protein [Cupriavidus basilensis]MDF3835533.1 metallophosphatase family protein [Cupriavidus basilensis]